MALQINVQKVHYYTSDRTLFELMNVRFPYVNSTYGDERSHCG
ncbi:MAG: hypothetical protein V7K26_28300 [Nostoc sp.]